MSKQYTYDDVPMTLNSISWQLKRIADALENINSTLEQEVEVENETVNGNQQVFSTKLRDLLEALEK